MQRVHGLGHLDILSVLGNQRDGLLVPLLTNQDGLALARLDLLEGVQALLINAIPDHHLDDGSVFVDEGERPVLQFPGLDALAVDVGELLDLERPLHARRIVEAAAHHQQGLGLVQLLGDLVDLLVLLQHFLDQFVEGPQAVNYLSAARLWKRRDEFVSKGNQLELRFFT